MLFPKKFYPNTRTVREIHNVFTMRRVFSSTINDKEIEKFSAIGSHWWDKNSISGAGPLHSMNPCRVSFIKSSLLSQYSDILLRNNNNFTTLPFKGLKILDVGCGGGLLSESLARLGGDVTGIDPSPQSVEIAKEHARHDPMTSTIIYKSLTIEELSQDSENKFDIVCSLEVIEHVDKPLSFLQQCLKVLKEDGSLFLSTINRTPKSFTMAILGAEYITRMVPKGTHDWRKFITPDELDTLVKAAQPGMELVSKKGMILKIPSPKEMLKQPTSSLSLLLSTTKPKLTWKLSDNDLEVNYIMHFVNKSKV